MCFNQTYLKVYTLAEIELIHFYGGAEPLYKSYPRSTIRCTKCGVESHLLIGSVNLEIFKCRALQLV